jgi:ABC-2 family transporter protein
MIWMTWRQFRTQALVALAVLLAVAVYLLVLGERLRHTYRADLVECRSHGHCPDLLASFGRQNSLLLGLLDCLLIALPGVIGIFWGAPLITRELEAGTHRLVWNQSVTRGRWLAVKLGGVGLLCLVVTGLCSALLTWAASPVDRVRADRFAPLLFDARNVAPLGYAVLAFALGAAVGLLVRRTVPAMALTLVIFATVQVLVPTVLRPHYAPPVATSVRLTAPMIGGLTMIGAYGDISGLNVPGGPWVVSTTSVLDSAGRPVGHSAWYQRCVNAAMAVTPVCLADGNIHVQVTEQPADRYWEFQWIETAACLALAVLLSGLCFWRIRAQS